MSIERRFAAIEVTRPADKLRCYVSRCRGIPRVKARLLRAGKVTDETIFTFGAQESIGDVGAIVESAMREIAAAAGARFRMLRM